MTFPARGDGGSLEVVLKRPLPLPTLKGITVTSNLPDRVRTVVLLKEQTTGQPPGLVVIPEHKTSLDFPAVTGQLVVTVGTGPPNESTTLPAGRYRLFFAAGPDPSRPEPTGNMWIRFDLPRAPSGTRRPAFTQPGPGVTWSRTRDASSAPSVGGKTTALEGSWTSRMMYVAVTWADAEVPGQNDLACIVGQPGILDELQADEPVCAAAPPATSEFLPGEDQGSVHVTYDTVPAGRYLTKLTPHTTGHMTYSYWHMQFGLGRSFS